MEVGRKRIGVCSLHYGQPVIQHGSEFCDYIIGEADQPSIVVDQLSRLEEYSFYTISAITISSSGRAGNG